MPSTPFKVGQTCDVELNLRVIAVTAGRSLGSLPDSASCAPARLEVITIGNLRVIEIGLRTSNYFSQKLNHCK